MSLKWLIIAILLAPVAEIAVFLIVVGQIGWLATIALTILTSLAGVGVIRAAGRARVARFRGAMGDGFVTGFEASGGGFLMVLAGILLVLPGFLTDIAGAVLLLPVVRRRLRMTIRRTPQQAAPDRRGSGRGPVIDLAPDEWRQVTDKSEPRRPRANRR